MFQERIKEMVKIENSNEPPKITIRTYFQENTVKIRKAKAANKAIFLKLKWVSLIILIEIENNKTPRYIKIKIKNPFTSWSISLFKKWVAIKQTIKFKTK